MPLGRKILVSQRVAFKDILNPEVKDECDFTHYKWNGLVAKALDHTSPDNIIFHKGIESEVIVAVTNKRDSIHTITSIEEPVKSEHVTVEECMTPIILNLNAEVNIKLNASFPDYGDYIHVLFIHLESGHKLIFRLVFRVLPVRVEALHPTEPYVSINTPVYKEEIAKTVKQTTIKIQSLERPLPEYDIPGPLYGLLNSGLTYFEGMTLEQVAMKCHLKRLLFNLDKKNPLNTENYHDLLKMFLYFEEHQLKKEMHQYDRVGHLNYCYVPHISRAIYKLKVPGLAEKRPSIVLRDRVYVKTSAKSSIQYEGIVRAVEENVVCLTFNRRFHSVYHPQSSYHISFGFNRFPIMLAHQAVQNVSDHGIAECFFPDSVPEGDIPSIDLLPMNNINEEQKQAVTHIVAKSAYPVPYIIFGPPGTGKTSTLVEAIRQIYLTQPNDHILVCCPSNSAANEIALRLLNYVDIKHIYRYLAFSYDFDLLPKKLLRCCNLSKKTIVQPEADTLAKKRIIISTLTNAGRLFNMDIPHKKFDYVMIDECGQATEPELLTAVAGIISSSSSPGKLTGQLVLIGDPKQLGPVVFSPLAKEFGFGVSMIERTMNTLLIYQKKEGKYNPRIITKLVKNYRSHPKIIEVSNRLFYENELVSCGDSVIFAGENYSEHPLIFHGVVGEDQRESNSPSFMNLQEVDVVTQYVDSLMGTNLGGITIDESHIGIIAPYKKQVEKIRRACSGYDLENLLIGSVEQVQGKERLIIIISTTRSKQQHLAHDQTYQLGFLKNPKRTNVALTRAKALLIVIGNPFLLKCDYHWCTFLKYCLDLKSVRGTTFDISSSEMDPTSFVSTQDPPPEDTSSDNSAQSGLCGIISSASINIGSSCSMETESSYELINPTSPGQSSENSSSSDASEPSEGSIIDTEPSNASGTDSALSEAAAISLTVDEESFNTLASKMDSTSFATTQDSPLENPSSDHLPQSSPRQIITSDSPNMGSSDAEVSSVEIESSYEVIEPTLPAHSPEYSSSSTHASEQSEESIKDTEQSS